MHPRASRETAGPDLPSCVSLIGFSVTLAEAQSGLRLRAGYPRRQQRRRPVRAYFGAFRPARQTRLLLCAPPYVIAPCFLIVVAAPEGRTSPMETTSPGGRWITHGESGAPDKGPARVSSKSVVRQNLVVLMRLQRSAVPTRNFAIDFAATLAFNL